VASSLLFQSISLLTIHYHFLTERVARLVYTIRPACQQPTVVFVSERYHYPHGLTVAIDPVPAASWAHTPNFVTITHTQPVRAINVTIVIAPTPPS
jgi:hypothetical protein